MSIRTEWFDKVDRNCPLSEYPRPQFERKEWICLNGEYEYKITSENADRPSEYEGKILVPFSVESEMSGVNKPLLHTDRLWYRRYFTLGKEFTGKRVILHFCAVDWQCRVWINGIEVGNHTGGYNPFEFDITDAVAADGNNELVVKVFDPTDDGYQQRGKQKIKPVGFWYTATSGIWQTVWIEPVSVNHIETVRILPDIDKKSVKLTSKLVGSNGVLKAEVYDGDKVIFSGEISEKFDIPVPDMKLWSPENPFLYTVKLTYSCNGDIDEVSTYFGMRKFSVKKDRNGYPRLALNNKPYFMKGLLDQGYWPESQLTAPTDEAMIFDIQKMKDLGFNMLRKHIKEEPLRWYYHCDRLGMLVWQDMISGGKPLNLIYAGALPNINVHVKDNQYKAFNRDKPEWRAEFEEEYRGLIDNLYNCVSICTWVPFNEGWGQFDAKRIGEWTKSYDPSRFTDHASGWHDQNGPDFKSVHKYILPVHAPTKARTAGRPYVLSEYGGYSWTIKEHVWNVAKSFGYVMFKNTDTLTDAYVKLHEKQIIPLIKKGLCATVYTQVSDVEFEVNGVYTYDRKVLKLKAEEVKKINEKLTY